MGRPENAEKTGVALMMLLTQGPELSIGFSSFSLL